MDTHEKEDAWIKRIIVGVILSVFLFLNIATFYTPEVKDNPLVTHLIAIIDMSIGMLIGYYWGSSKGSKDKERRRDENAHS